MAKRSTIGENPLDAVNRENPLDTVVPDLSAMTRTGRGQPPPEVAPEVQARLAELEAGLKTLVAEAAGLKTVAADAASLKATVAGLPGELAGLRREVDQLKAELAQIRASAGPGDLPFWMRGRKK